MKKITILLILISVSCFSQIAIERPNKESENTEPLKPTFKEDIDLNEYKTAEQFLGLIEKEILLLPENSKYDFVSDRFESISYLPKEKFKLNKVKYKANSLVKLSKYNKELIDYLKIEGNYFVVDSIQFYDGSYSFSKKITDREFNKKQAEYSSIFSGRVDIYTHHKESNEIIIFNISNNYDADKLISVSYFNYLTDKYLDKKVILKKSGYKNYRENYGLSNYDRKFLDSTQIFEINKIVLSEPNTEYHKYFTPVFSLKNLKNSIKEIEFYKIKDDLIFLNEFNAKADLKEERDLIKIENLSDLKEAIKNPNEIYSVNFTQLPLSIFPEDILKLKKLKHLSLGTNLITKIPKRLSELKELTILDISNNEIEQFPECICSLQKLEYLFVGSNNFNSIPSCIGDIKNLKVLDLSGLNLEKIPDNLYELKKLKELGLKYNSLKEISKEISNLTNLVKLYLQHNSLENIPKEISNLKNLERLFLNFNKLKNIPKEILNLKKIRELGIKGNELNNMEEIEKYFLEIEENYQYKYIRIPK